MLRILFLIAIVYFMLKIRKVWKTFNSMINGPGAGANISSGTDDIMVQDPYCEIYFPKRDGIKLRVDGKDLYFCSSDCRDAYINENK